MALRAALPPGTSPGPTTRRTPPLRSRAMWPLQPGARRTCRSPVVRWTVCSTTASSCDSTIRVGVANSPNGSWNVRSGRVCRRIARTYCCPSIAMTTYSLEPDEQQMRAIAGRAVDFVVDFISSLPEAPHVDLDALDDALARVRSAAPQAGTAFEELIDQIALGARKAFNPAGPGYMAFIPGGGLFTAAVADFLSLSVNRFVNLWN